MSAFVCDQCDRFSDADDGCEESPANPHRLICIDCMMENECEADDPPSEVLSHLGRVA